MSKHKARILAIDPGTREMGVALLEGGKPIYYGVKLIKDRRSPHHILREGRGILLALIKDLKPQLVVVEKAFFANNRNASLLNVFVDEIRTVAKRKGLRVASYAPSTVKKFICGNGKASKKEVATVIVSRHPELKVFLTQDREWKEKFHQNMFDAVALGMIAMVKDC